MESYELFITKNAEIFKDKVIILYTYLLRFYRIPVHFCGEIFLQILEFSRCILCLSYHS